MLIVATAAITRILKRLIHNPRATGISLNETNKISCSSW
jgi:hypothetical protein